MKFLKKLKSSNFWVSMISAVVLILQAVFNVDIKTEYLNQIILGILGLLVMSGIVTDTPNNEVAVNQRLDLDSVKENINLMFTQIGATLQTDISNILSQLKKINITQNAIDGVKNEVSETENIANENELIIEDNEENKSTSETVQVKPVMQEIDAPKNEL